MLTGSLYHWASARRASQSASFQSYRDRATTEAVRGGASVCWASGSAFSRHTPSRPRIRYLYRSPTDTAGTNSSHTPLAPSERIGQPSCGPQPVKSPTTLTPWAFGAHTAKDTPSSGTAGPGRGAASDAAEPDWW